ncbi:transcriptional regulator family: Fungal Specific TF [Penicillium roqueforti]|uniref:transcriptional regulator family: Fungal Specific TF n=1 Tax=Penicillium roqueforti TaxID=5082 RepID=UPI00190950DC|nr:transcriptional regulator family: Fungal Specific TF [Penicillium roqueforti]KAF9250538.1 transcriptional regulator family: Fungal Specific TF [Penicillium roqueforti]KAI2727901.1 transcriptional regulator family: Fungal Specific TF [Penicillium roqueforti]KAI3113345.1 transcriptional regulator family: Fungal Specific TF [Penicillium roqueforti]KAI3135989.1 transcriptional regulator family: Fungal Specific TF [Penicillium roqueforti]KAI3234648.1 transcriptional regulator family: Fungal Spec
MNYDALRACDLCFSRKVRCDKQLHCANCTDAGVECSRTRARRPRRQSPSVISALGERLLTLERTVSEGIENRIPSNVTDHYDGNMPSKKMRLEHASPIEGTPQPTQNECAIGSATHLAEKARIVIQGELDGNECMDRERKAILRSALQFVDVTGQRRSSITDKFSPLEVSHEDFHDGPFIAPSPELLYMLLPEPTATIGRSSSVQWPDHISDKTLEKMASTILSDNDLEHGQEFYQYCICVYVKAIFHLFQKPRAYMDPRINAQFLKSKKLYETYAFRALKRLNFLNAPTLPLIQSLISAAFFMQYLGNMSQSWIFNSYAARLITALGYHEIRNPPGMSNLNEDIYSAVCWCFYLDRTLSTLLYRPLSLPEPCISPANLISADQNLPHIPLIRILFDLAQVQGELLNCGNADNTRQIIANHSRLQERMEVIYSRLQSSRVTAPDCISADWISGEFCYYAILVDILRSRLKCAFSPLTHKECVSYSRKSLRALHHLQKNLADVPGFVDPYPSFLTWTVLLYPFSPFFVLFCNIIGELDMDDYNLMQEITQSLSQFAASPYISKLLKLLYYLQNLCVPLIQAKQRMGPQVKVPTLYPSMAGTWHVGDPASDEHSHLLMSSSPYVDPVAETNLQQLQTTSDGSYAPDDALMWQLFNSQISLEWFESNPFSY